MGLILFVILLIFLAIFIFLQWKYSYWSRKGVEQLKCHFLLGHIPKLKSLSYMQLTHAAYAAFRTKAKVVGVYVFAKPVAVILDLDVVKSVLIRDFNIFSNRIIYRNHKDILSQHLFYLEGPLWRPLRGKFTPAFAVGKVKFMFSSVKAVAEEFSRSYDKCLEISELVNVRDLNNRYTVDVIGTCIFGIECNSLKDPNAEFYKNCLEMFAVKNFNIKWHLFKLTYVDFMKFLGFKKHSQNVENFFRRVVREGLMEREKHGIVRHDFVDILLDMRKSENTYLSYDQIAAQFFIFFAAGYETASTAISHVLFELGRHFDEQEKVRFEILNILESYDNELTYQAMMDMKYLDQVIKEILRLFPALAFLERVSTEDYQVPDTNIILDKGTQIFIPVDAIHHDPEIYENPYEFRPERFSPSEEVKRHPQAFLPFGDGPRNCIGLRIGHMQTKIGLIFLLSKYRFSHSSETCPEIEFTNHTKGTIPAKDIYLKVERI